MTVPARHEQDTPRMAPPSDDRGVAGWMRKNLFSSWGNAITTLMLLAALDRKSVV